MIYPKIEEMLSKVDSRFTLVIASAKRARQINRYFNARRHQELPQVRGPQVKVTSENPLTIALEEVAQGKISYERLGEGIK